MSDITALLQPLKDRLAAATPGPWEPMRNGLYGMRVVHVEGEWEGIIPNEFITMVTPALRNHQDAEFIAQAPTDQAKLIAAIEAVAAPHQESFREVEPWAMGYKYSGHHCIDDGESWPCTTIAVLTQALDGDAA